MTIPLASDPQRCLGGRRAPRRRPVLACSMAIAVLAAFANVALAASPSPVASPSPAVSPSPASPSPVASPSVPIDPNIGGPSAIAFEHPLNLGLPLNPATIQDRVGFLWFSSQDGLIRYDGYETTTYRTGPNSISNDNVASIAESADGTIWIGSVGGGIDRYDRTTDSWTHYRHDASDPDSLSSDVISSGPQALFVDREGNLWVGTNVAGLDKLDPRTGKFAHFKHDTNDAASLMDNSVYSITQDSAGRIWIGTSRGLDRLDPGSTQFLHYRNDPIDSTTISQGWAYRIVVDSRRSETLWVGTIGGGLNRLDVTSGVFSHYKHEPGGSGASNDQVLALAEDGTGRIWVGWYLLPESGGLSIFDPTTEKFTDYHPDANSTASLSSNTVKGLLLDSAGTMWVVLAKAIDKVDRGNQFRLFQHDPRNPQSLSDDQALAYYEDRAGTMWFGTVTGGLNRYDRQTGAFTAYRHARGDEASLDSDSVTAVYEDSSGAFWVASGVGTLCLFDRSTGKCVKHYRNEAGKPFSLPPNNSIRSIVEDKDDPEILWIGADMGGLIRFDKRAEEFTAYVPTNAPGGLNSYSIMHVFQDSDGILWLSTQGGGLNRFDKKTGVFSHYTNDPNDPSSIGSNTLWEAQGYDNDHLWVATLGGGLEYLDKRTGKFEHFTKSNGFPANGVFSIRRDAANALWLGTDEGLVRFNPQTNGTRIYDDSDGLQGHVFLNSAACVTRNGEMWFGGVNGIDSFYPGQIQDNPLKPKVVFTALTQGGAPVKGLQTAPDATTKIAVDWQSNYFEFEVAALNYTSPQKNQYQFKLEGLDRDWSPAGTTRTGRYSGLPDGSYTLLVRASNNDGIWSDQVARLEVVVVAPFWRSGTFFLIVAMAALAALAGAVLWRIRSGDLQRRRLEGLVAVRTGELEQARRVAEQSRAVAEQSREAAERARSAAEAASDAKSRFLSSVSHELRSPLNTILGFTRVLLREPSLGPEPLENLRIVLRSGEHLHDLIDSVLDLARVEADRAVLEERAFDLHRLLYEIRDMFALAAEEKGLTLSLQIGPDVPRHASADDMKLRQILVNLMSNAVKFTPSGSVTLRVRRLDDLDGAQPSAQPSAESTAEPDAPRCRLGFEVVDTGPGMTREEIGAIFGAFVQTEAGRRSREGTGLGLAISRGFAVVMGGQLTMESEPGRGTTARLTLPITIAERSDATTPAVRVRGIAPGQGSYRILAVDDRWTARLLIVRLLTPLGFEVQEASGGQEAVDIAAEWQPHLILMDMRMPGMGGIEATRRIKATPAGRGMAIIALTASSFEDEREEVISGGCDDFLRKPFREEELFDVLQRHLNVRFVTESPGGSRLDLSPDHEALLRLAPESRQALEAAVVALDPPAIGRAIDTIRSEDPALADRLRTLAASFDYDTILSLLANADIGAIVEAPVTPARR